MVPLNELEKLFEAWCTILFSSLNDADIASIHAKTQDAVEAEFAGQGVGGRRFTGSNLPTAPRITEITTSERPFRALPGWPEFRATSETARKLDTVLDRERPAWRKLAASFMVAMQFGLFRATAAGRGRVPWIPLTFWLCAEAGLEPAKLAEALESCLAAAAEYEDERSAELTRQIADKRGLAPAAGKVARLDPDQPARRGYLAMLDANYQCALQEYRLAADAARGGARFFEEWVCRHGEFHASSMLAFSRDMPQTETRRNKRRRDECRERIHALEDDSEVRSWIAAADTRVRRALEQALESGASMAWHRAHGGSGFSVNDSLYMAWRSFKDLEQRFAPPQMLEQYLRPLLWTGPMLPATELRYRLVYDTKRSREWLATVVDQRLETLESQRARDIALLETYKHAIAEGVTSSERLGQLRALSGLRHVFQRADVSKFAGWLRKLTETLGWHVKTYSGESFIDADISRAVSALGPFLRPTECREIYINLKSDVPIRARRDLFRAVYDLPWWEWALTERDELTLWADELAADCTEFRSKNPNREVESDDELAVFALYRIASTITEHVPDCMTDALRIRLHGVLDNFDAAKVGEDYLWETLRGCLLLDCTLGTTFRDALSRWDAPSKWNGSTEGRREFVWSAIADAWSEPWGDGAKADASEKMRAAWAEIEPDDRWAAISKKYLLNPHHAAPLARFLATCLQAGLGGNVAQRRLLEIARGTPGILAYLARTVREPRLWGDYWAEFIDLVLAAAAGAVVRPARSRIFDDSGAALEWQLGALDLFAEFLYTVRSDDVPLAAASTPASELVSAFRTATLLATGDERTLLANHAAYTLVRLLEVTDDEGASVPVEALRRVAGDSRVIVRMAAAYGAARLQTIARSQRVRSACMALVPQFSDDPNAMVARQLALGLAEARFRRGGAGGVRA